MQKIRVLLAEDHTIVKHGLIDILEKGGDLIVVAEVDNGQAMIQKYKDFRPDIVLSDIEMPHLNGIEAAKEILGKHKEAKLLFLTAHTTEEYIYWAKKIGAKGLIPKTISPSELVSVVKMVAEGSCYFMNMSAAELEDVFVKYEYQINTQPLAKHYNLTAKEKEVLIYIAQGLKSKEIAEEMHIGKKTIDYYRGEIMKKVKLTSLAQLVKYAVEYCELGNEKK